MKTKNESLPVSASPSSLAAKDLEILRSAFPDERLGVKVQSFNRERTRAMLVLYLQHTDVQDRLEEVDPSWRFEVVSQENAPQGVYVRGKLTLKGVSRENVGEGGDPKAALSDALKRCAMLFGVGRYLYDSPTVWTEYDDQRDRFRSWNVQDYLRASAAKRAQGQSGPRESEAAAPALRSAGASSASQRPKFTVKPKEQPAA